MTADGGEWDSNLMFEVPLDHEEVQRLAGRYQKCVTFCLLSAHTPLGHSVGGLTKGLVVELSNGAQAVVLEVGAATVKLDANPMMAGRSLTFELELVAIDRDVGQTSTN